MLFFEVKRGSLIFFSKKERITEFMEAREITVTFLCWLSRSSRSGRRFHRTAPRAGCPPVPPPLLSHDTTRCLPVCLACSHVTACYLPGRGLASSALSLRPTLLHAVVFLIARLIVQLLRCSRGLACSECSIRSTLPRSAAFLTACLLGAWGLGSGIGTDTLLHIWLIVATGAPVRREGCHWGVRL